MMYRVTKRIEIAGAHKLLLPYESKCQNFHGHNWIIYVTCESEKLNDVGMVVDFTEIKKVVMLLDHGYLNEWVAQPTAERIAEWIMARVDRCVKVEVQESEGNTVCVTR